ncbi:MAG: putative fructoselysine transporter [Methanoregulaceae archaeon PtaB.Bin056]|nr:MAG: putative fructoselysine transporter [Methanoregulaceae archaeon PtaB.Bin056]
MIPIAPTPPATQPRLARRLGFWEVTLSGIGIILGAGIYALIGTAAGTAGNAVWLSFVISALVAFFTALSYMELSSMMPDVGAEYEYTARAVGRRVAMVIGWLIIFSGILGAATVSLGFAGYLGGLLPVPVFAAAFLLIAALCGVLLLGVKESAWVAVGFTLIEVGGLLLIIAAGLPYFSRVDYLEMPLGLSGVVTAAALVFFAYQGFEEMVKFSEETRRPERTVPFALITALAVSTVLYILVCLSAVSVVGWEALAASSAPFATVAATAWGADASLLLSVIALFATANTVLMMMFASSRISYGMARAGSLPGFVSRVHPGRHTPWTAILLVGAGALLFMFTGDIAFVANVANFTLFVTFVVVNLSVIILRYKEPGRPRPFSIPGRLGRFPVFPLMGLLSCIFLLVQLEPVVLGVGALLTGIGMVIAVFYGMVEER